MSTHTVQELLNVKPGRVVTIPENALLQDALETMARQTISSLLVVKDGKLVGIVSERDYIRRATPRRVAPWDVTVGELMTREVICVGRNDLIKTCMQLMCGNGIRHLPVVEGKTVLGLASITDALGALRSGAGDEEASRQPGCIGNGAGAAAGRDSGCALPYRRRRSPFAMSAIGENMLSLQARPTE
jgi:CBS domain-containing protein